MITSILNKNLVKILALFIISPGSRFNRKEIKEKTEMNNSPLDNSLCSLVNLGIIKEEKNIYSLQLNKLETEEIINIIKKDFKELLNLLPLKIFYILIDIEEKFLEIKKIEKIILFGSYAKLIFTDKSDIDIAVITKKEKQKEIEEKAENIIEKISKKSKKEIQLHFFTEEDLKHKEDPLIKDILRNGKKLIG